MPIFILEYFIFIRRFFAWSLSWFPFFSFFGNLFTKVRVAVLHTIGFSLYMSIFSIPSRISGICMCHYIHILNLGSPFWSVDDSFPELNPQFNCPYLNMPWVRCYSESYLSCRVVHVCISFLIFRAELHFEIFETISLKEVSFLLRLCEVPIAPDIPIMRRENKNFFRPNNL